jgi:hypothetical protein
VFCSWPKPFPCLTPAAAFLVGPGCWRRISHQRLHALVQRLARSSNFRLFLLPLAVTVEQKHFLTVLSDGAEIAGVVYNHFLCVSVDLAGNPIKRSTNEPNQDDAPSLSNLTVHRRLAVSQVDC